MFYTTFVLSMIGVGVLSLAAWGQVPQPPAPRETAAQQALPLTRIVLYASGVGYFQRDSQVDGHQQVALHFKVDNINDLLKSMIVQDLDGGQVTTVTYDSRDPITRTLKSFAVDLTENPTLGQLLAQIRGERVEVATPNVVQGVILGVETKQERLSDDRTVEVEYLNLLTDNGLRSMPLAQIQHLQISNPQLNRELQQALAVLAASHDRQKKTVMLTFDGQGQRRVRVAYIIETPVWKTSYRLVLSDTEAPFLQGWALVENTTDEDWQEVNLSLISGRPISFIMDMYEPLYVQRPVVVPEVYAALRPQVYEQAIEGVNAPLQEARRSQFKAEAERDVSKTRQLRAMPASPPPAPSDSGAAGRMAWTELDQGVIAAAQAGEVGELFEYAITTPVTLARQKSAMLPIVNAAVQGSKLAVYNERVQAKHPLHGFRLQNNTTLHLLQGPITVFDDSRYAGDARLDDLAPGQERLLSYALDLKTEVEPVHAAEQRQLVTASIRKGTLLVTHKATAKTTYNVRNRDQKPRLVLIEHPFRADWQLTTPETATERTREVYRFAVTVAAGQGVTLPVQEDRQLQQAIRLTDAGPDVITYYLQASQVSDKVKAALQQVVVLRNRLEETRQQQQRLGQRVQEITQEQERLRQNMGHLAPNSELYNRYVRKLDQQETEIETLRHDIEQRKDTADTQQRELNDYLLGLDIDA